jgi:hypothetical protein
MSERPPSPAAERNKQPILEALRDILGGRGTALEIASGAGQHAAWFAAGLPGWTWQPTEADQSALPVIAQSLARAGVSNVRAPLQLDVMAARWPAEGAEFGPTFDAVFCANMLHASPWATCAGLMRGSARYLSAGGVLITYGPYFEDDVVTAPGNLAFDQDLRARNPEWGIRHLKVVCREAGVAGLALQSRRDMPANNLLLVFRRAAAS